jgi:electron transfer flavoprotein alpha subunit
VSVEKILIFVEAKSDAPRKASLELLSEGRRLAETGRFAIEAVTIGKLAATANKTILSYVERLTNITDPALDAYTAEGYALALASYAREVSPKLVLAGATRMGRDFMPRVAVLLDAGIASDVTGADWLDEPIFIRPVFGGKVLTEVSFVSYPALVTVRPKTFTVSDPHGAEGTSVERKAGFSPEQIKTKVLRIEEKTKGKVDLSEADIIVTGGHGMKAPENFNILEALAGAIDGTIGATRSVVDAKWRDYEDQVGKSGKTVSPKLYIAAGVSGAIHHIMGMDTAKVVLAINKDPNAPIFKYADYGIVGDLFEVVPALTEELKKRLDK